MTYLCLGRGFWLLGLPTRILFIKLRRCALAHHLVQKTFRVVTGTRERPCMSIGMIAPDGCKTANSDGPAVDGDSNNTEERSYRTPVPLFTGAHHMTVRDHHPFSPPQGLPCACRAPVGPTAAPLVRSNAHVHCHHLINAILIIFLRSTRTLVYCIHTQLRSS